MRSIGLLFPSSRKTMRNLLNFIERPNKCIKSYAALHSFISSTYILGKFCFCLAVFPRRFHLKIFFRYLVNVKFDKTQSNQAKVSDVIRFSYCGDLLTLPIRTTTKGRVITSFIYFRPSVLHLIPEGSEKFQQHIFDTILIDFIYNQ